MKKKLILLLLIVGIGAFAGYKYLYKEHRDIGSEEAAFDLSVANLQKQFTDNDSLANQTYSDKTIGIYGKITAIDLTANTLTIDEKLSVAMKDPIPADAKQGESVKIKGRFVGYDDLLEELKMDQASLSK